MRHLVLAIALVCLFVVGCRNQVTSEHKPAIEHQGTETEMEVTPSDTSEKEPDLAALERREALRAVSKRHPSYPWADRMDFIEKALILSKTPYSEKGFSSYYENGLGVVMTKKGDDYLVEIKCEEGKVNADWGLLIDSRTGEVKEEYEEKHEPEKTRIKFQLIARQMHKKQTNWKQAFEKVQARNHLIPREDLLFIEGAMINAEEYGKEGFVGYEKWGLGLDITSEPGRFLVDILSEKGKVKNSWRARIIKNTGALIQEFPFLMEL